MTDYNDYETVLTIIKAGIDKARRNPKPDEPTPSDDYTAWVILQELRRGGWSVERTSNSDRAEG
jgi:hypothetical protein